MLCRCTFLVSPCCILYSFILFVHLFIWIPYGSGTCIYINANWIRLFSIADLSTCSSTPNSNSNSNSRSGDSAHAHAHTHNRELGTNRVPIIYLVFLHYTYVSYSSLTHRFPLSFLHPNPKFKTKCPNSRSSSTRV
jgi:hypothetical protein